VSGSAQRQGFTLIEVLAVSALISVVFLVALNFYTDLSTASVRATDHTRDVRRAAAILDRVARDFESAFLITKPPEVDPIAHPWLFIAEAQIDGPGADRVKFVSRNHDPSRTEAPQSDLAMVAYLVEPGPDAAVALYRWSSPHLPESLDRSFPNVDDDGVFLIADDLGTFGIRFLSETGELADDWDSTTILESSTLPRAVEIELSMVRDEAELDLDPGGGEDEPVTFRRKVILPIRPLDLAALIEPEGAAAAESDDEEGDEDSEIAKKTIGDCIRSTAVEIPAECVNLLTLADSQPDLAFAPDDFGSLPTVCQALVKPVCR
jgi:prepilin-type N-terminal cleavage/methylation domain-containing protein